MIFASCFFFASFIASVHFFRRNGLAKQKRFYIFPCVDLAFALLLLAIHYFDLINSWFDTIPMILCFVYLVFRSWYIKKTYSPDNPRNDTRDNEDI